MIKYNNTSNLYSSNFKGVTQALITEGVEIDREQSLILGLDIIFLQVKCLRVIMEIMCDVDLRINWRPNKMAISWHVPFKLEGNVRGCVHGESRDMIHQISAIEKWMEAHWTPTGL